MRHGCAVTTIICFASLHPGSIRRFRQINNVENVHNKPPNVHPYEPNCLEWGLFWCKIAITCFMVAWQTAMISSQHWDEILHNGMTTSQWLGCCVRRGLPAPCQGGQRALRGQREWLHRAPLQKLGGNEKNLSGLGVEAPTLE